MKITGLETIPITGRALLVKLFTDQGIVGFGEALNYEHWRVVGQAVRDMADYLVGKDPFQIEDHWQTLFRSSYSRSMPILVGALSGIDMALWDVLGKALGRPVWQLLGGSVRNRVRVYTGIGGDTDPQALADSARRQVEAGFNALKMVGSPGPLRHVETAATMKRLVARVAAVREAVGDEVDIAVDLHRRFSPPMAMRFVAEIAPLHPLFVEEPCHPENNDVLATIARSTTVPIATGERHLTRWAFREIVEHESCAILQPDVRHCGGITELRKIANMAEVHQIAVAPHNAAGPVGVAASIHVMATVPNFLICEGGGKLGQGLFEQPLQLDSGFVVLPTQPGLGVDMEDAAIEAQRDETYRQRGMFRHHDDGSFADF